MFKNWSLFSSNLRGIPIASGITKISEKIIAASRSNLFIGIRVVWHASSGVLQSFKKSPVFCLRFLYSGRYLPACLMIHMGVLSHVFPRRTCNRQSFLIGMIAIRERLNYSYPSSIRQWILLLTCLLLSPKQLKIDHV